MKKKRLNRAKCFEKKKSRIAQKVRLIKMKFLRLAIIIKNVYLIITSL